MPGASLQVNFSERKGRQGGWRWVGVGNSSVLSKHSKASSLKADRTHTAAVKGWWYLLRKYDHYFSIFFFFPVGSCAFFFFFYFHHLWFLFLCASVHLTAEINTTTDFKDIWREGIFPWQPRPVTEVKVIWDGCLCVLNNVSFRACFLCAASHSRHCKAIITPFTVWQYGSKAFFSIFIWHTVSGRFLCTFQELYMSISIVLLLYTLP